MHMKKQILLQTAACVLNILFAFIAYRFAAFDYVAGIFIYAIVGGAIVVWGVRTIRHRRELDIAWGLLNALNIVCGLQAAISGLGHLFGIILRGWYPPF